MQTLWMLKAHKWYNMKYLITESQRHNLIFKYLNKQDFITIESQKKIYLVNSEGDKIAQIVIDKEDGFCEVNYKLIDEISSFFSIKREHLWDVISKWVSEREGIMIYDIWSAEGYVRSELIVRK